MAEESWQQIRKIFDDALRRKPEEREEFVWQACGENKILRAEVESLLSSLNSAESFLETPVVAKIADALILDKKKLERGEKVGHYVILRQIGAGGMGEVYLAEDTRLNRKVALKLLAAHITEDKGRVSRFQQEAFATSALNHPNIVTIYEIGKWNDRDFITTEFIEGETLRNLLQKKKLAVGEALDIALQIASALSAAHNAGIIHRDIKPENIMIRPDGLVKVLDFGIAKYRPTESKRKALVETEAGEIIGTAAYMSPEQARGLEVDAQTDIWSLGVILYEMIARKLPFRGETKSDRIVAILEHDPEPLTKNDRKISPQLQQVIDHALTKDKKLRYADIAGMAEDLRGLRETTGDKFSAPFILPAQRRFAYQRKYLFASSALLVFLVGAIALWLYLSSPGKTAVGERKVIAVLPLKPINTASRDELYEVGIAESLIHRLGSLKGLIVRPLSATRKYADIEQDPLAAGLEQQADYVLASNYQIAGGKIRVTSQLLNVETGQIEETYKSEKNAGDIFALQDAISEDVGKLFQTHFAVTAATNTTAKRGTDNEEAYRLYLQAMYLVDKENPADSKRAIELFDEALALDPNYAKAWANKARAYCHYAHTSGNSPDAAFAKAKPALERAFALDNNLADAHAVLGIITTDYDWDFVEGEKRFRQAIELSPSTDIFYRWFASRLSGQGRYDEAIAMAKTTIDLNPNYIVPQIIYGRILYSARRYDDSIRQMERVIEMDSANPSAYNTIWRCFHKKGDYQRAYEAFMKAQRLSGTKDEVMKNYETLYAKSGWQSVLLRFLEIIKTNDANGSDAYTIATLSALAGDREQSLSYLDKAFKNRSLAILSIVGDPGFDSMRGDPRFEKLVRRVETK